MKYTKEMTNSLNEILEKSLDAEKGYKSAAEHVNNIELKHYFKNRAEERSQFAKKLQTELEASGEEPTDSTSFTADAHRVWMNLKTALSSNDEEAILKEIIRGEEASVEEYNELLENNALPKNMQELILQQRTSIINALETARSFEVVEA